MDFALKGQRTCPVREGSISHASGSVAEAEQPMFSFERRDFLIKGYEDPKRSLS